MVVQEAFEILNRAVLVYGASSDTETEIGLWLGEN